MVVDHAADVSALSRFGWEVLNKDYRRGNLAGQTVLDVLRERVEALRKWTFKPKMPKAPVPVKENGHYLADFKEGTYAYYMAKRQVEHARRSYERDLERYEKDVKEANEMKGVEEKQEAINKLIAEYEDLEKALLEKGAKTFYELHPEVKQPDPASPRRAYSYDSPDPAEFSVYFDFKLGDLTDETREKYIRLFEAAWSGDLATVKTLTLSPWTDMSGDDQPPLKITVQDDRNLSPFAIAVLQGHLDVATAIMEMAQAQHVMPDPSKQRRYGIEDEEDASNSDDSEGEVPLYSEIVDDDFTKEDVGEVSLQVKSKVSPLTMLQWDRNFEDWAKEPEPLPERKNESHGFSYFGPRKPHPLANKRTNTGSIKLPPDTISKKYDAKKLSQPDSLIQLALHNSDLVLLTYLLKLGHEYNQKDTSVAEERRTTYFRLAEDDYRYALQVGRSHLFMELVKHTGAGLPLDELVEKYGIEIKEKPKYYQGLTVHGTKRKDWAARDGEVAASPSRQTPPLLQTIDYGSLELVEWWLSDAPMRCYRDFAEANKEDKRIRCLTESKTGFEGAARKFLATRSQLAVHCAVMASPTIESMKMLRYLIETMPGSLEAKNLDGLQPLQVAFHTYHKGAAKLLIEAGADQMCRDKNGKNLVHTLLDRNPDTDEQFVGFKAMLELIDKRLVHEMFLQRSGSLTPLAQWISEGSAADGSREKALRLILSYSGGKELGFISGEGDTPLHYAVKREDTLLVQILLEHDATLLNRENATGRTPFEMAEDAFIADKCIDPPPMPTDNWSFSDRRAFRYGLPSHWHEEILRKDEELFAPDRQGPKTSKKEKVWEILQGVREKLIGESRAKRRLVTLGEANEVARRLAGMKSSGVGDGVNDVVSQEGGDLQNERVVSDEVRQGMYLRWFYGEG